MTAITRLGDSGSQAGQVGLVDLVKLGAGDLWVTPVRTGSGRLRLIAWAIADDGKTVTRTGDSGDQAGGVELIASAAYGLHRLVTAVRTQGSKRLKLIAWQVSTSGAQITRLGDSGTQAGAVDLLDVDVFTPGATPTVVTSVRATQSKRLRVITWQCPADASTIVRVADSGTQAGEVDSVAGATATGASNSFVTAVRATGDARLKVIRWQMNSNGTDIKRLSDSGQQAGDVTAVDAVGASGTGGWPAVVTAVRTKQAGRLRLISWRCELKGFPAVTRTDDSGDDAGAVSLLSHAQVNPTHYTAVRTSSGKLRVIRWNVETHLWANHPATHTITRTGDSGNQAGAVDLIKCATHGGRVVTAVRGSASKRLKVISWSH